MKKAAKPSKTDTGLIISKTDSRPLSKNQQAFNKLTQRIEKLRQEIEKKERQLDEAMRIYSTGYLKTETEVLGQKRILLDLLWAVYLKKQLSKPDQRALKHMLQDLLAQIIQQTPGELDEELKKVFGQLEGESYDKVVKREEQTAKEEMQEMFDNLDMDVDMDDFDLKNLDPEFAAKLAEANRRLHNDRQGGYEEPKRPAKKKTAKQLEKEKLQHAVEEAKQKNISTIYRQLAKLFHPDLEQDEARRQEKQVLMQQLTAAYEAKNLHALLGLELKWIHNETNHLETLTEDKLGIYLAILREQAADLENEKYYLFSKPQYSVLLQNFGSAIVQQPLAFLKRTQLQMERLMGGIKSDINRLMGDNPLRSAKQIIKEWQDAQEDGDFDFEDFLEMFH